MRSTSTESSTQQHELLPYLLDSVRQLIVRYVCLPAPEYADVMALWAAHAHAIAAATTSPRLIFKSPEKASGKTRCLEVLETLVPAPLATVNASVAAVFRLLKEEPTTTLLFDEVDSIFNVKASNQHEELRALLNAGYRRGATVARVVGEGKRMRVERFPVFAATALASIGDLPETVESRAIIVPMRRRTPDEPVEPFRLRNVVLVAEPLREALSAWAYRYEAALERREPQMPAGISDRLADSWEPLLAVAELADEAWTVRARTAAERIAGGHVMDEASLGVQLLADIKACLASDDRVSSINLLAKLNGLEESAWGAWHDGRGMTARDLARRLKPYGIGSRPIRPVGGGEPFKGYQRADFADAWQRYPLPLRQSVSTVTELQAIVPRNRVTAVTVHKRAEAPAPNGNQDWPDDSDLVSLAAVGAPEEME